MGKKLSPNQLECILQRDRKLKNLWYFTKDFFQCFHCILLLWEIFLRFNHLKDEATLLENIIDSYPETNPFAQLIDIHLTFQFRYT